MSRGRRSPVQELQQLATEPGVDITALLRKALLVASKLRLEKFRQWIGCELNGYFGKDDVPPYRNLHAEIRLKNPYHGLVPVMFEDPQVSNVLCRVDVRDPVGGLKYILDNQQHGASSPIFPLTPQQTAFLIKHQDGLDLPPVRTISENQIASILDAVRTAILEWALKLEQECILGEDISFTEEEVNRAGTSTQIRIENFQGILGNVQDSNINQTLSMNVQKENWQSLEQYMRSLGVAETDIAELKDAIHADSAPVTHNDLGKKVSAWIGKMVGKAASGVWQVGIGAAGSLLASAIRAYYGLM